jgi:dihydroorotate dehydrogenase
MNSFKLIHSIAPIKWLFKKIFTGTNPTSSIQKMGISFPNRIGLAAGFDKNASFYHLMPTLGFGFVEIGTVTPKPQVGNPKPRLFRLPKDEALINRMGFNNLGVDEAIQNLKKNRKENQNIIIGGNIGKNKITPNEEAVNDYNYCFQQLFPYVDYFVVNVSSPNTPGLRELQDKKPLSKILNSLQNLNKLQTSPKPILLKIAPDLEKEQINDIIDLTKDCELAGLIISNTTIDRAGLSTSKDLIQSIGNGGLSGKPVRKKSTEILQYIRKHLGPKPVIIGVGGISDVISALEKLEAGADLIQVYTGFIFQGPSLVKRIKKGINDFETI